MAGGINVRVADEFLDGDHVGAAFQEPSSVGVAEFVEGGVFYLGFGCDGLEAAQEMADTPAFGVGEDPRGGAGVFLRAL